MKLHKLQILSCHTVIGNNCFKMSNVKLLAKCKCLSIANMMRHSVVIFIHNVKTNIKIQSINELFTTNKSNRILASKTYPKYEPKTKKLRYFLIYKGNNLYNRLPDNIIKSKKYVFKKSLKQYIQSNFNPFKLHQNQNYNANSSDSSNISSDNSNY